MVTKTEGPHAGEFIASEANGSRSRELVTFVSGTPALEAGEIVGKVTASGKYTVYDDGAADGTETAAGVLVGAVDASAADAEAVVIVRDAEVVDSLVTVQTGADRAAAITDLESLGILAR